MGAIIRLESSDDEDPGVVQARIRESQQARRISDEMTLSAVAFAISAAAGEPGRLSGSGSNGARVTGVTVAHGSGDHVRGPCLRIETALNERHRHRGERALAEEALVSWLQDGLPGSSPGSDAAFVLALRANERARRQLVSRAVVSDCEIDLDGTPSPFTCVRAGSRWAGVTRTETLTITISASGVNPGTIQLRPVTDSVTTLI